MLACHGPHDAPITVVGRAELATTFIERDTAAERALALQHIGWEPLRIVAFYLPTP